MLRDEFESAIGVSVPDQEDDRIALVQDDMLIYMSSGQLQQLVSLAIKSRWIDSIPM
jgi:hypothetical protein